MTHCLVASTIIKRQIRDQRQFVILFFTICWTSSLNEARKRVAFALTVALVWINMWIFT